MGICLDTEHSDGAHAFEEGRETWAQNSSRNPRAAVTPIEGRFPMHNAIDVQFESPKVPVIFVLGGPGSGKVTHCDNLMQEKTGVVHINMTDLLQQYVIGNDMQDFSLLSSKTVTEVLMLEMKMAPNAKTYLVSGYPRNMRDVVEYSERIQVINGVILISWRQKVLERQIDYGAKLGQVVLSLARMELNNFYKHVMPVADYFDQNNMLVAINGERHPGEVFTDFREAVLKILGMQDNPPVFSAGQEPNLPSDLTTELPKVQTLVNVTTKKSSATRTSESTQLIRPQTQVLSVNGNAKPIEYQSPVKPGWPSVLWVIGGPGSNKAVLCEQTARATGWSHISLGRILRTAADSSDKRTGSDAAKIRECVTNGEMVPLDIIMKIVESHIEGHLSSPGIILDGFPRDLNQVAEFESKFKQKPTVILLDCSKLQLGRGRLDDSVTAFRRRLEIFRQSSLPMLKAMDNIGRLTIVDGDTDTPQVQEDFKNVVREHVQYIKDNVAPNIPLDGNLPNVVPNGHAVSNGYIPNGTVANGHLPQKDDAVLHDLEDEPMETISNNVSKTIASGINHISKQHMAITVPGISNGIVRNKIASLNQDRKNNIKELYGEVHTENHI